MSTETKVQTEKTKEEKRKERIEKDAQKFREIMSVPRPGMNRGIEALSEDNTVIAKKKGLELSDIVYVDPKVLKPNSLNEYPPLTAPELDELVRDIEEKGVLVPLIVRLDDVVICGHNRLTAALKAALETVPAQRILSALTEALERDIMRSENDRRRGGNWSRDEKEKFIKENFGDELKDDNRGGDRKSAAAKDQKLNSPLNGADAGKEQKLSSPLIPPKRNLARVIEEKSRGRISEASAKEIVAGMRKRETPETKKRLSDKDKKREAKIRLELGEVRKVIALLEDKMRKAREREKTLLKELKRIGENS